MNRKNKKMGVFSCVANVVVDEFTTTGLPRPISTVLWRCLAAAVNSETGNEKQKGYAGKREGR